MDRTVSSSPITLEEELKRWERFRDASPIEERTIFEDLKDECHDSHRLLAQPVLRPMLLLESFVCFMSGATTVWGFALPCAYSMMHADLTLEERGRSKAGLVRAFELGVVVGGNV